MKIKISYFYNIRFFQPSEIPISTALWDPKYYHDNKQQCYYFLDSRNVINGLKEDSLIFNLKEFNRLGQQCQKDCPYKNKVPYCEFMVKYKEQLSKIDFDGYLLPEFKRTAEEVRKLNNFTGEPTIVLMVHEKPDIPCAERPCLIEVFRQHGIEVEEWQRKDFKDEGVY